MLDTGVIGMRQDVSEALLKSFEARVEAADMQNERGVEDKGKRSEVTSGKHLDELVKVIASDLESAGILTNEIFSSSDDLNLPGWFRATKRWDVLAYHGDSLIVAIELKSIGGSYGKNLNNRVEEAIGESTDA